MATSPQRAWRAPCPNCGAPGLVPVEGAGLIRAR